VRGGGKCGARQGGRESVLFIGTRFSNLYTAVDTPAEAAWLCKSSRVFSIPTLESFNLFMDAGDDAGLGSFFLS